jgi:hypothetical protein
MRNKTYERFLLYGITLLAYDCRIFVGDIHVGEAAAAAGYAGEQNSSLCKHNSGKD